MKTQDEHEQKMGLGSACEIGILSSFAPGGVPEKAARKFALT